MLNAQLKESTNRWQLHAAYYDAKMNDLNQNWVVLERRHGPKWDIIDDIQYARPSGPTRYAVVRIKEGGQLEVLAEDTFRRPGTTPVAFALALVEAAALKA